MLKRTPVGKSTLGVWFRKTVEANSIKGGEFRQHPTLPNLHTTMISKLQRLGHSESQIVQRTGQKSITE